MSTDNRQMMMFSSSAPSGGSFKPLNRHLWRDLLAYWLLGLCNNYGYVVMLTAAHDIIATFSPRNLMKEAVSLGNDSRELIHYERECHLMSTGAILLADVLPSLCVKILLPFVPFWVHLRIFSAILCSIGGFLLVGMATSTTMALLGVIVTSASSGIGETTFLAYSANYNKNVISTWSSGTGGAGVLGALSYATLRSLGLSPRDTMLIMISIPLVEALTFWILLRSPKALAEREREREHENDFSDEDANHDDMPFNGFHEKISYIKQLFKYMLPLSTVYFLEYFINQGLFELVHFENIFLDKAAQYRWLNVVYQIGVLISRSSVNLVQIDTIWLMSVFQLMNTIYFVTEVIYLYTPSIWITFTIVLWEGVLGGAAYVNTFYKMSKEIPRRKREFAVSMVVQGDSYGIALAGFLAIPAHNAICTLPAYIRRVVW